MKYPKENGIFGRKLLSRIFVKKNKRPDEECFKLEGFVRGTMSGCGWDFKELRDFHNFNDEFGTVYFGKHWKLWYDMYDKDNEIWAVCEKKEEEPKWAWFKKSMRISKWFLMNEENCIITKKIVPFKNGYYKTIDI